MAGMNQIGLSTFPHPARVSCWVPHSHKQSRIGIGIPGMDIPRAVLHNWPRSHRYVCVCVRVFAYRSLIDILPVLVSHFEAHTRTHTWVDMPNSRINYAYLTTHCGVTCSHKRRGCYMYTSLLWEVEQLSVSGYNFKLQDRTGKIARNFLEKTGKVLRSEQRWQRKTNAILVSQYSILHVSFRILQKQYSLAKFGQPDKLFL